MNSPLSSFLKDNAEKGALPMYMPGHKRNFEKFPWLREIGIGFDITEITGADNFNDPEGAFAETEAIATELWRSRHSFPLVGGSTGGVLAAIYALSKRGEGILIGRNCHKSVYNAAELLELRAEYVYPETDPVLGCYTRVSPESVKRALEKKRAGLVVITSPTYEGFISEVSAIADICHSFGARLLVDEAHGAHLGFGGFHKSAVQCGADIVVQSLHKTLPSPTQTAILHLNCDIPVSEVRKAIGTFQSSSPSYLLTCGIDQCIRYMAERGETDCAELLGNLRMFRDLAYPNDDPAKIVLPRGEYSGIEFEMTAPGYVIAYAGLGDTEKSLGRLASACGYSFSQADALPIPKAVRAAYPFEITATEPVELDCSAGRTAGEYVWCYPPGSPVIVPGEIITNETIDYITALISRKMRVSSTEKALPGAIYCRSSLDKRIK